MVRTKRGSGSQRRRSLLGGALLALATTSAISAADAGAAVTPITAGTVDWGVKQALRDYVVGPVASGSITVAGGVSTNVDGSFRFPVTGGSYDSDTQSTVVELGGSVRLRGHAGDLDITISEPRVEISATGAGIVADVRSREVGRSVTSLYPDLPIGTFALGGVTPTIAGGMTTWSAIPTTVAANGAPAYGGYHAPGVAADPLSLSYSGPGGTPLAEQWSTPGKTSFSLVAEAETDGGIEALAVDNRHGTLHLLEHATSPSAYNLVALDRTTLAPLGAEIEVGRRAGRLHPGDAAYNGGSLFVSSVSPDANDDDVSSLRAIGWDGTAYSAGASLTDEPISAGAYSGHDRFHAIASDLLTVTRVGSGPWSLAATPRTFSAPTSVAASGSGVLIAAGALPAGTSGTPPLTQIDFRSPTGTATAIAGTTLPSGSGYTYVAPSLGNSIWAVEHDAPGRVIRLFGSLNGQTFTADPSSMLEIGTGARSINVDRSDGVVYIGTDRGTLVVVRDGTAHEVDQPADAFTTSFGRMLYVAGEADGDEVVRALRDLGTAPVVTRQPQDTTAQLADAGSSTSVAFTTAARGSSSQLPPTVRWQSRPAGSLVWSELPGQTSTTLTVTASVATAGTRYRAIFTNAAGEVASAIATLSVAVAQEEQPEEQPPIGYRPPPVIGRGLLPAPRTATDAAVVPTLSRVTVNGRRLSLRVSTGATVRAKIARRTTRQARTSGTKRPRVRWVTVRTLRLTSAQGGRLTAPLPKLPVGRYRVTIQATTSDGGRSAAVVRTLIVKRAATRR